MSRSLTTAVSFLGLSVLSACGGGNGGNAGGGGVAPPPATHFSVTAPASAPPGIFVAVVVTALDASNNVVPKYSGTVHFTSSDPQASLPPDTPLFIGTGNFGLSLASLGNQTVTATDTISAAISGSSGSIDVAADPNAHGFRAAGNLLTARASHTATLLANGPAATNGKILITGGSNSSTGEIFSSAELFDPATGTSTATGSMTVPRFAHTATLLADGKVLITGGTHSGQLTDNTGDLSSAELYDPSTGTFSVTGSMSEVRTEHTATLLASGKVLVAGGSVSNVAELYDPGTGTFTPTAGPMTVSSSWSCTATLLNDGTVLIAGGNIDEDVFDGGPSNTSEIFNPVSGTFTATENLAFLVYSQAATLLANGQVLMTGGINGVSLSVAQIYDPATKTNSATGPMNAVHAQHTATLLTNGTVLVAGGSGIGEPVTAELFDPTTATFSATGSLGIPRALHTATLLSNGDVLVIAGSANLPGGATASVEVYR